jgi:hypothetical protein
MLCAPHEVFAVFQILEMMHAEIGQATLDKEKALHEIESAAAAGHSWVAIEEDKIVAALGLWPKSEWWYSREKAFFSKWLYVLPAHRKGGHVLRMLLNEVVDLVDTERIPAFVHVHNTIGRRFASSRRLGLIAAEIGVFPSGSIFAFKALKQAA